MPKADVEEIVVAWLQDLVGEAWPVSGNKPARLPEKFITVDRTGGPRESMVLDRAEILIEVYHKKSRLDAKNKANDIADNLNELLIYSDDITRARVNSVVNLQDIIAQYERYQVYCDVYCRR